MNIARVWGFVLLFSQAMLVGLIAFAIIVAMSWA
jgi:hypothetical protein